MFIKTIVIDGFKSYAQPTEIGPFDTQFNAITGLNGSGKSNILDAICFLLGISNLSQVRATNLQDLVYKSGQAGISKATVSIVFDNSEKAFSPEGYADYPEIIVTRQIVIGGKNKYMINGVNAQNSRVHDLFSSIGLNVNNPHFLIMQGRITKVLNMKPPEILGLLEEAAGTKQYERKKDTVQKTIEKKDAKLREIDTLLQEEITPTLTRLRKEHSSFLEYKKVTRHLEHLMRFYVAWQFCCLEEQKDKVAGELVQLRQALEAAQSELKETNVEKKELEHEIDKLCMERDEQSGGAMEALEMHLVEQQKADAVAQSVVNGARGTLRAETKRGQELKRSITESERSLAARRRDFEAQQGSFQELESQAAATERALQVATKRLQAVSSGLLADEDGKSATLEEQLRDAQQVASDSLSTMKQTELRLKHSSAELKKKEADLTRCERDASSDLRKKDTLTKSIAKLEKDLAQINYSEEREEKLRQERRDLRGHIDRARANMDRCHSQHFMLRLEYTDPEPNWDRRKVKGIVAKLITVVDSRFASALEVAGGSRLYNVVVDNEQTGKKLLDYGQLKQRITLLPLNKISSSCISENVARHAQEVAGGPDRCWPALQLVRFEPYLQAAMEYVFGNTFICVDLETAKRVTFHPNIQRRSVTLDGDQFDPAGTLSGGAGQQSGAGVLQSLNALRLDEDQLSGFEGRLQQVEKELGQLNSMSERFVATKRQLDGVAHELSILEQQLAASEHQRLQREVDELREQHRAAVDEQNVASKRHENATAKARRVEEQLKDAAAHHKRELKSAEDAVAEARNLLEQGRAHLAERREQHESLRLELAELTNELNQEKTSLESSVAKLIELEEAVKLKEALAEETKQKVEEARRVVAERKDELKRRNQEINDKGFRVKRLEKASTATQGRILELQHRIENQNGQSLDAARHVDKLLEDHTWIVEERVNFGKANGNFDFEAQDPQDTQRQITKLSETKEKLGRTVNMRANNMLSKAEEQYTELKERRLIVLENKRQIQNIIDKMDSKKNELLMAAYERVNENFCQLFGTVLPGSKAQLVPPEGQTVLHGLEFRIAFGGVWKSSLSELSGGQRSLVALSLILALLMFKPAPLYILDEVDAALDLSHTQNIGQLIRNYFNNSQFIVVSLKDGMFNNANVLFKTKFVDGVSAVSRHVPSLAAGGPTSHQQIASKKKRVH